MPADRDRWTGAPSAAGSRNDPSLERVVAAMNRLAFTGGNWTGGNDSQQMSISRDSGISGQQGRDAYLDALTHDLLTPDTPVIRDAGDLDYPTNHLGFQILDYKGINDFASFREYYGLTEDVLLVGPYAQNFANSGEDVTLQTSAGGADIVSFTYRDGQGWPASSDGLGHSLIPLVLEDQAEGTLNEGGNWRASVSVNGSPGGPDL
ncbi:MAG: hypothetical protein GY809_15405 [Planctomycetes bacterium]|nr:hypothetical protein [Planctomycetota bacterium]